MNILEEMETKGLKSKLPVRKAKSCKVKLQIPKTLGSRDVYDDCLLLSY